MGVGNADIRANSNKNAYSTMRNNTASDANNNINAVGATTVNPEEEETFKFFYLGLAILGVWMIIIIILVRHYWWPWLKVNLDHYCCGAPFPAKDVQHDHGANNNLTRDAGNSHGRVGAVSSNNSAGHCNTTGSGSPASVKLRKQMSLNTGSIGSPGGRRFRSNGTPQRGGRGQSRERSLTRSLSEKPMMSGGPSRDSGMNVDGKLGRQHRRQPHGRHRHSPRMAAAGSEDQYIVGAVDGRAYSNDSFVDRNVAGSSGGVVMCSRTPATRGGMIETAGGNFRPAGSMGVVDPSRVPLRGRLAIAQQAGGWRSLDLSASTSDDSDPDDVLYGVRNDVEMTVMDPHDVELIHIAHNNDNPSRGHREHGEIFVAVDPRQPHDRYRRGDDRRAHDEADSDFYFPSTSSALAGTSSAHHNSFVVQN